MVRKTAKSGFAAVVGRKGGRDAFEAHKADETNYGSGGSLPAGIEGGVAQLVDCKFDTFKKGDNEGEYYFYAAGIVKEPKVHDRLPVEGLRTSIMEPVCDTPTRSRPDVDAHLDWIMNQLRMLGVSTEELSFDDLEDVVAALKEEQPHFRFRTWVGDKQTTGPFAGREPRVNEVWMGICDYEDEDVDDVVDDTAEDEEEKQPPDEETDEKKDANKERTLIELGKAADVGDEGAGEELLKVATEVGISEEGANDAATWVDLVTLIEAAGDSESTGKEEMEAEEEEADWVPEKTEVYYYKPPRARKRVECEITGVFVDKKTCNLKSLDDGKTFKAVAWDKLEEE